MTNIPVEVELKNMAGKAVTVLDDELHALIHDGLVSYQDALTALKKAKLALDKRFYPWLRDIENLSNGEFDGEGPSTPETKPELLDEKTVKSVEKQPDVKDEPTPDAKKNPNKSEGAE